MGHKSGKSIIVLIIDHETFQQEEANAEELTPKFLHEIAEQVNSDASHICGYEAWMDCFDVPDNVIGLLGGLD